MDLQTQIGKKYKWPGRNDIKCCGSVGCYFGFAVLIFLYVRHEITVFMGKISHVQSSETGQNRSQSGKRRFVC